MTANTPMTAPQRGNLTSHKTEAETSAVDEALTRIDTLRTDLRKALDDLNETDRLLRKAVKEQKASDKEINRARSALKSLQAVEL
jgi:septal ring factor EnvC (AmiA/AmiB activator)